MSTLVAGHDNFEVGWMLMCWIPAIRRISKNYDKTVIICRPAHKYLYQDFATKFEYWDRPGLVDRWKFEGKDPHIVQQIVGQYPGAKIVTANKNICCKSDRKYLAYGKPSEERYQLIIHARAETKYGQSKFNWPVEKYVKLLKLLGNPTAASIGTRAFYIPGTADLRGVPLERLCNVLSGSKLAIGPSSGAMHLSHLCRCPILVWTGREYQKAIKGTNRQRYEKIWRPFKDVPVTAVDAEGWQPKPETIAKVINGTKL